MCCSMMASSVLDCVGDLNALPEAKSLRNGGAKYLWYVCGAKSKMWPLQLQSTQGKHLGNDAHDTSPTSKKSLKQERAFLYHEVNFPLRWDRQVHYDIFTCCQATQVISNKNFFFLGGVDTGPHSTWKNWCSKGNHPSETENNKLFQGVFLSEEFQFGVFKSKVVNMQQDTKSYIVFFQALFVLPKKSI